MHDIPNDISVHSRPVKSLAYPVISFRECQGRKSVPQRPPGRLVPIPPAIAPFHRIGIDLLGRFPKSAHGNKWIIVCTDYSTRYAITKALPTAEVDEIAKFLLEEIVQDEVERVLAPVSTKPTETRPRPTYATVTRKYRAPVQKFPLEPRKTDVWRTADNRPVCFHCGRPGHVMRYCRERKAVFDNSRNRRRNFDDVGTEEEIRRPNSSRRFTPSPTRGRSPIRRYRSPSPYRRSSQSPGRRSEEN
ncbi:CCHC-type domain-containing protein [Trichonephila clavipes]|nr:CCHC-type domain-containing protein [Trichonephila clavipes]